MLSALTSWDAPVFYDLPERLAVSAWFEHIPFGVFLIEALRPRMLVELGVDRGTSYCAFCQAIKTLQLDTRCFAVDTWSGDEHAGFYGEEVWAELQAYHDPRYAGFSKLIRGTFDAALTQMHDGEIDLLHLDGLHTYDAVRRDFENWLPKMSERGIILFHDSNVREGDFGVHRLWKELREKYPSFEFLHSYGLGVLAVGRIDSPDLQYLFNADEQTTARIREFFFRLGRRISIEYQALQLTEEEGARQVEMGKLKQEVEQLQVQLFESEKERIKASQLAIMLQAQLEGMTDSKVWKVTQLWWRFRRALFPKRT